MCLISTPKILDESSEGTHIWMLPMHDAPSDRKLNTPLASPDSKTVISCALCASAKRRFERELDEFDGSNSEITGGMNLLARSSESVSCDPPTPPFHGAHDNAVTRAVCAAKLPTGSCNSMSYRTIRPSSWPEASIRPSGLQASAVTRVVFSEKVPSLTQESRWRAMWFSLVTYARRSIVGHHAMRTLAGALPICAERHTKDSLHLCSSAASAPNVWTCTAL